ncbi:MAG TPA: ATP-grasp domain-containing protein [Haliangium sp.]|nr:ATP-grasp domain-containing protein [Haliangium sp.]
MKRVVFVAPFFLPATLQFVNAVAMQPDVTLGLVSQEPLDKLPEFIRSRLSGHYQVRECMDLDQLTKAVSFLISRFGGGLDRLLAALEQLQEPLGHVRDRLGIPGMGAEVARNFRDKGRMKDVLRDAGIPCARHATVGSAQAVLELVQQVGFPVVIKPPEGAGAVGTYRIKDRAELDRALQALQPGPSRPLVVEEFVTGRENSIETVMVRGQAVWDSHTRYSPAPLHVLENSWIQWAVLLPREVDDADTAAVRTHARAALRALGMETGLSHMEWFHTSRGAVISEVAARPPGAQIMPLNSYAHDADFHALWARLIIHEEFTPPVRKYATGVAFFRGQFLGRPGDGQGRIVALHGLERAQQEIGHLVVEANLPKLGHHKRATYEGDGYAILRHPDTAVVEQALKRLVSLVQVEVA